MPRALALLLAAGLGLTPTPAMACAPPNVGFTPGSVRVNAAGWREINYALEGYRPRSGVRFLLSASGREPGPAAAVIRIARRRAEAVRAALVSRGVPARMIAIDSASIARAGTQPRWSAPAIWIATVDASTGCG